MSNRNSAFKAGVLIPIIADVYFVSNRNYTGRQGGACWIIADVYFVSNRNLPTKHYKER